VAQFGFTGRSRNLCHDEETNFHLLLPASNTIFDAIITEASAVSKCIYRVLRLNL
jgi:hypothetical protein